MLNSRGWYSWNPCKAILVWNMDKKKKKTTHTDNSQNWVKSVEY